MMNKRTFLKRLTAVSTTVWLSPQLLVQASPIENVQTPFILPPLPYAYDALAPFIDKQTMEVHHTKHHQAYLNNLNEALARVKNDKNIEELMRSVKEHETVLRNHGGGHYNHSLFWQLLTPQSTQKPTGKLATAIDSHFGSFDNFKTSFTKEALGRFGSGWAWLVGHPKKGLSIVSTPNQDNPLMTKIYKEHHGQTPLLCIDVWEHAYYLTYQNKRADYINAFWNIVNWNEVQMRFDKVVG